MQLSRKLIVEHPMYDLQYESIQENRDSEKKLYMSGPFLQINERNKNNRIYEEVEMLPAIADFKRNYIDENRAGGECNHSDDPDVKLDKLAHKIISLKRESDGSNYFIGKSEILTANPPGRILEGLIKHNMKFGVSSKCLGRIVESSDGNKVKSPIIIGIDAVYDPSAQTAFVNGICENREYIIGDDGNVARAYESLDKSLSKYPSKHSDEIRAYIFENLQKFLAKI